MNSSRNKSRLILHVGLEKTGTTSLQNILLQIGNPRVLQLGGRSNFDLALAFSTRPLPTFKDPNLLSNQSDFLAQLKKAVLHQQTSLILSSEHLSGRLSKDDIELFLGKITDITNVSVILVTRENKKWIQSKYKEAVKNGYVYSIDRYRKDEVDPYSRRCQSSIICDWQQACLKYREFCELDLLPYSADINQRLIKLCGLQNSRLEISRSNTTKRNFMYTAIKVINTLNLQRYPLVRRIVRRLLS